MKKRGHHLDAPRRSRSGLGDALAIPALCLVQFVDVLGVTVVVTALPAMLAGVRARPSSAALVLTGYAMCFGGLLMLGARLGDRYGHRRLLLLGLGAFAAASLMAACAGALAPLIAARCLQGAAAAVCVPNALRLLIAAAPGERLRRRALAGWSATGAAAGASGFLLGGALTQLVGWRAVFWINVPLATLLAVTIVASAPRPSGLPRGGLDIAGAAVLTAALMAAVGGASLLERPQQRAGGLLVLAGSGALLGMFVRVERRARDPLFPRVAARDVRLRTAAAAAALNTATTSSAMTLASLYLQTTRGAGAASAGLRLLPFSACVVVGSTLATRVLRHRAPRVGIGIGLAAIALGDAVLLLLPAAEWLLPVGVAIAGAGIGVSSVAANALGTSLPAALQGVASGALNTAAQLGTALGVSALLVVATVSRGTALPFAGTRLAWSCAAAAALCGAVLAAAGGPGRLSHRR